MEKEKGFSVNHTVRLFVNHAIRTAAYLVPDLFSYQGQDIASLAKQTTTWRLRAPLKG